MANSLVVRKGTDLAKRRGKNQVNMPANDYRKSVLGLVADIAGQQLQVSLIFIVYRHRRENRTKKSGRCWLVL